MQVYIKITKCYNASFTEAYLNIDKILSIEEYAERDYGDSCYKNAESVITYGYEQNQTFHVKETVQELLSRIRQEECRAYRNVFGNTAINVNHC